LSNELATDILYSHENSNGKIRKKSEKSEKITSKENVGLGLDASVA